MLEKIVVPEEPPVPEPNLEPKRKHRKKVHSLLNYNKKRIRTEYDLEVRDTNRL